MKIGANTFRGQVPRLSPRLLPDNAAQDATNARLLSGDLTSWRQFAETIALDNVTDVRTIFRIDGDVWLAFEEQVDIARAVFDGGLDHRVLLTCPALFATPRYTDVAMATDGAQPYPAVTLPLGVPSPDDIPSLSLGVDNTPTSFSIDVTDPGDQLAEAWISSPTVPFSD